MKRAAFLKLVASYGATIDADSEENGVLNIDAPRGFVWKSHGLHCICEPFQNISQSWKPAAYKDAAERMRPGLEPCDIEDCDVCNE